MSTLNKAGISLLVAILIMAGMLTTMGQINNGGGGGGSGTVSANNGSAGAIANYAAAAGSTTVGPDANLTDASNTLTYTGSGGISAKVLNMPGATSGTATLTPPAVAGTAANPLLFSNAISWPTGLGGINLIQGPTDSGLNLFASSGRSISLQVASANAQVTLDNAAGNRFYPATGNQVVNGVAGGNSWKSTSSVAYLTDTNCQLGGASGTNSPAACGAAAAGAVAIPASQTSYVVNTTAVTANSHIIVQQLTDNSGISTATCNSGATNPVQSTRTAGTSFTIALTSVASVTCIQYWIID